MRTHVDTSAKAGMLYAATPQRTWCQRCTTKAHIPPPFLLSHRAQRERKPAKRKTETHTGGEAGKKCMPGRRTSRGKGNERRSHERNKGWPAAEQGTRAGKGARQADGTSQAPHRTEAPEREAPEGQEKSGTTHHDKHRTDTTHTAHTHTRAHSTWPASPGSPPRGRAAGGGGAPDPRRPSQRRTAPPPEMPYRHPHGAQRQPARARAVGPVLGPHARTDRTGDTRVAEPWLPAPEDGRPGKGQRLTPDAPHNGGRPPPPGTAPDHPDGTQPPDSMQAKGTVLGPHTHTSAPTARGWRTPTACPVCWQLGEGERLTSDAPHKG